MIALPARVGCMRVMMVRHDAASRARGLTLNQLIALDVLLAVVLMTWNIIWWTLGTHRMGWPTWQAVLTCSLVLAVAVRRLLPLPALAVASVVMATEAAVGLTGSWRLPCCCTRWRSPGPRVSRRSRARWQAPHNSP